jgi:YggT family protein
MIFDIFANFISILATALTFAIIIRALMSWFAPTGAGAASRFLLDITEPVLAPIRRILPPVGGWDFSPILAIVLIQVISQLLIQSLLRPGA